MATYKKARYRRSRNPYFKRRYKRGRYFYRRRRRYRRTSRKKPLEYKRVEGFFQTSFICKYGTVMIDGVSTKLMTCEPGFYWFKCIGPSLDTIMHRNFAFGVKQGTGAHERIGGKINPVKLRFWGSLSYTPLVNMANGELANNQFLQSVQVRIIVFQIRAGNTKYTELQSGFSEFGPFVSEYEYNQISQYYVDPVWLRRFFTDWPEIKHYIPQGSNSRVQYLKSDKTSSYFSTSKAPYRLGLGSYVRILKSKTYTLQSGYKTNIPIRFKTKKPARLIWIEESAEISSNARVNVLKNPIYIAAIPLFNTPSTNAEVAVDLNCDMFYTDL